MNKAVGTRYNTIFKIFKNLPASATLNNTNYILYNHNFFTTAWKHNVVIYIILYFLGL